MSEKLPRTRGSFVGVYCITGEYSCGKGILGRLNVRMYTKLLLRSQVYTKVAKQCIFNNKLARQTDELIIVSETMCGKDLFLCIKIDIYEHYRNHKIVINNYARHIK